LAQQLLSLHTENQSKETLAPTHKTTFFMEVLEMTKKVLKNLLIGGFVLGLCSSVYAGKPTTGDPPIFIGNGFGGDVTCTYNDKPILSGELVGECGDKLSCTGAYECSDSGTPKYGNVVNVPRFTTDDPITIVMESGRKGPKSQPAATTLMVTDWCTESFPDDGSFPPPLGDEGRMLLPKNSDGYAVYVRVLGKPHKGDNGPEFVMMPLGFESIENEYYDVDTDGDGVPDEEVYLLGFISPDGGVFGPFGDPVTRSGSKGNGAKKATDISPLFEWAGDICYVQGDPVDEALFCEGVTCDYPTLLCCVDNEPVVDGVIVPDGTYDACITPTIDTDADGIGDTCEAGYVDVTDAACKYVENDWVFNIADFVNVLFEIKNNDTYNVQIRFYPLPLNQGGEE
jgi:hypothetical protein